MWGLNIKVLWVFFEVSILRMEYKQKANQLGREGVMRKGIYRACLKNFVVKLMEQIGRESKFYPQRCVSSAIFPLDSCCPLHPLRNYMSSFLLSHCHGHLSFFTMSWFLSQGTCPPFALCQVIYSDLMSALLDDKFMSYLTLLSHHRAQSLPWSSHLIKKKF